MYIINKIDEKLIVIGETEDQNFVNSMQLVIGEKRAALIDTGFGMTKDLHTFVRTFTELPIVVLITHGHLDHVGNADLFGEIYMSELDGAKLEKSLQYSDLRGGDIFDLGGNILEIYALPGHTPGSVCVINRGEKYALTGDAVNQCTWLWWDDCDAPDVYAGRIARFKNMLQNYGICDIYHGHSMQKLPQNLCEDMISALNEVANGEDKNDTPYHIEWTEKTSVFEHKHGSAQIIYDRKMLQNSR